MCQVQEHPLCFKNFPTFHRKSTGPGFFFNKVAGLKQKETLAAVFPCEVFEISRTSFLQNTSGRLLLQIHEITQLAQRRCDNVVTTSLLTLSQRSKMRVVPMSVSDVVTTPLSNVIKTLPQRSCNVATTFSILLQTILISFPSPKYERVTKVLSGIKHTSALFKRTLYL